MQIVCANNNFITICFDDRSERNVRRTRAPSGEQMAWRSILIVRPLDGGMRVLPTTLLSISRYYFL